MQGERGVEGCRRTGRDERGQVVVLFALLIPMLLALGAVVLDVGNWYVHKRHLQTLVDAGALAGAPKFVGLLVSVRGSRNRESRHPRRRARVRGRPVTRSGDAQSSASRCRTTSTSF